MPLAECQHVSVQVRNTATSGREALLCKNICGRSASVVQV